MKIFTVEEANETLAEIRPQLEKLRRCYALTQQLRPSAKAAAECAAFGGGMAGGTRYVKSLYEIGKITVELNDLGVQLKDYSRGLIDFPVRRGGRIIFLCWQFGDDERITWWHEIEAGFAGRQPLDDEF